MKSITRPMQGRKGVAFVGQSLAAQFRLALGTILRERRLELGLTQAEVGKLIGTDNTAISSMERGDSFLKPELYRPLAEALQMPLETMGKLCLRYQNPHTYAMIYGLREEALKHDLERISDAPRTNRERQRAREIAEQRMRKASL